MNKRDRKIQRIADVQARLHRIAEWQVMECQARENALEDRQRRIIDGFNDEARLPDLVLQAAGRNLRAASVEQGVVAKAKEKLADHARDEGCKLKHALRMVRDAAGRAFRNDEKRILEDEIDKTVQRSAERA